MPGAVYADGRVRRGDHHMQLLPVVGTRVLLAKTCVVCELFLGAEWYHRRGSGYWHPCCRKCNGARQRPLSTEEVMRKRHNAAVYKAWAQAQSLRYALPPNVWRAWTDDELAVLARPDLTLLQKAIMVRRTYNAATVMASKHHFKSLNSNCLPMDLSSHQWVIWFRQIGLPQEGK